MTKSRLLLTVLLALALGAGIFACGGDDDISYPFGVTPVKVALFSNTTYVDYQMGTGNTSAEASLLEGDLLLMGHEPTAFNGVSAAAINTAVSGKSYLLIPKQKIGNLINELLPPARAAIATFVNSGGTLVVFADNNNYDAELINGIFGYSIINTDGGPIGYVDAVYNATEAAGTVFEDPDYNYPGLVNSYALLTDTGWLSSSLPVGVSNAIFDYDMGTGFATNVVQIKSGSGRIIYLGLDKVLGYNWSGLLNRLLGGTPDSYKDSYVSTGVPDLNVDVYSPDGTTLLYARTWSAMFPIGQGISAYIKVTDAGGTVPRTYTIHSGYACKATPVSICFVEDTVTASDPDKYEPNDTSSTATFIGNDWGMNHYMSTSDTDWFRYQNTW